MQYAKAEKKVFAVRSLSFVELYKRDWAMPFVLIYEQSTLLHKVTSAERKKLKKTERRKTMRIIGMSYSTKDGERKYTLEVSDKFDAFYKNAEAGRNAIGEKVESIFVGSLDCSQLKVGMEIELIFDRMRTLANGKTFQPIKRIDVLTK